MDKQETKQAERYINLCVLFLFGIKIKRGKMPGRKSGADAVRIMVTGILFIGIFSLALVFAEDSDNFSTAEYNLEDYKVQNYENVYLIAEKVHHCSWKPDAVNDGYKICGPEVIIWNGRDRLVSMHLNKEAFDFGITGAVRDRLDFYYSTDYQIYQEKRLNEPLVGFPRAGAQANPAYYNAARIGFINWKKLENAGEREIAPGKMVGVKAVFEIPQYEGAFYNFAYRPSNWLLDPNVSECGQLNINNGNYTLNRSLSTTGTCIVIANNSITLDLNGYNLTGDANSVADHGVDIGGYNGTTVKNGYIYDFGVGIYGNNGNGGNFTNLTIKAEGSFSSSAYGIYIGNGNGNYVTNVNIKNMVVSCGGVNPYYYGIYLYSSSNNVIHGNDIANSSDYGIYLTEGSNNNNVTSNIASLNKWEGVTVYRSSYNTVRDNVANSNEYGMGVMQSSARYNTFINNTANYNRDDGFYLYLGARDNQIVNLYVNSTSDGYYLGAVNIEDADHNVIRDSIFITNQTYAVGLTSSSVNNTFLNVTYEAPKEYVESGSQLIRKWYYRAYVNDTGGNNVTGAEVVAYNSSGTLTKNLTTGLTGWTELSELVDYVNNGTTKTYYSNYTINASHPLYQPASHAYNVTAEPNRMKDVFTLADVTAPGVNLTSPENGTILKTTGVTFNCSATDAVGLKNATLYFRSRRTKTLSFRQDGSWVNTTNDSQISADSPDTNYGSGISITVDNLSPHAHAVIKFPNIFGNGAGQVPFNATILQAILTLVVFDSGNNMRAYRLKEDWLESQVTWRNRTVATLWGNDGADGEPSADTSYYETFAAGSTGARPYNVKKFVQNWSDGLADYGIVLIDGGTNGVDFYTSNHSTAGNRPLLTVTFEYENAGWHANQTKNVSGTSNSTTFALNLTDDSKYEWNCLVYDQAGNPDWADQNFTFTINSSYNFPPYVVQLNNPQDGQAGVILNPVLNVTVADPEGTNMNVTFFGREKNDTNFTIIVLPDTQKYSMNNPGIFTNQTKWINNSKNTLNIVFVTHEGDIVDTWNSSAQWQNANNSMSVLDSQVPYGVLPGNHDMNTSNRNTTYYNAYFPVSRFSSKQWWGGNFSGNDNNYESFSAGGQNFTIFHMSNNPPDAAISWLNNTLKAYPSRSAIITTHDYLDDNGARSTAGNRIWNGAAYWNDNVFLVLAGHVHSDDGEAYSVDTTRGGTTVHQIMADYQGYKSEASGFLRIMKFAPAEKKIYVKTFSPYLTVSNCGPEGKWIDNGCYINDSSSQFTLDYPFNYLGQDLNVANNTQAEFTWQNLKNLTAYEWRVRIIDSGGAKTTSNVWNFTTAS